MLISLQISVGREFIRVIPLFHALTYSSIGVSEISYKCPWQLCKQSLLLQPRSCELLSAAGERQSTFCCHCLQHKLTMTHHPLHSSLGCRTGFIINSQGFLYVLFQTIDKKNMLKFGKRGKKKKSDSNTTGSILSLCESAQHS